MTTSPQNNRITSFFLIFLFSFPWQVFSAFLPLPLRLLLLVFSFFPLIIWLNLSLSAPLTLSPPSPPLSVYPHSRSNGKSFKIHNSRFAAPCLLSLPHSLPRSIPPYHPLPRSLSLSLSPLCRPQFVCVCARVCVQESERDLNADGNPLRRNTNKHMVLRTHMQPHKSAHAGKKKNSKHAPARVRSYFTCTYRTLHSYANSYPF